MIFVFSVPSAEAVAVPIGVVVNAQQVPVQFTRLPTTDAQFMATGAFGVSPLAVTSTFERIWPLVTLSDAEPVVAPATDLIAASVVVGAIVGATFSGQSISAFGRPASFVTVKMNFLLTAQGLGDCGMFM